MGRPSSYTDAKADMICEAIAQGKAVYREAQDNPEWPDTRTVYRWLDEHEDFRHKYARAREMAADKDAEDIVHIADNATDANIARLQVDARKWRASKFAPKKYGDKVLNEHSGPDGGAITIMTGVPRADD